MHRRSHLGPSEVHLLKSWTHSQKLNEVDGPCRPSATTAGSESHCALDGLRNPSCMLLCSTWNIQSDELKRSGPPDEQAVPTTCHHGHFPPAQRLGAVLVIRETQGPRNLRRGLCSTESREPRYIPTVFHVKHSVGTSRGPGRRFTDISMGAARASASRLLHSRVVARPSGRLGRRQPTLRPALERVAGGCLHPALFHVEHSVGRAEQVRFRMQRRHDQLRPQAPDLLNESSQVLTV